MKEKIAILTNFMEFNPGNSLTGIVSDQIKMLRSNGHEVHLVVNSNYHDPALDHDIHPILPFFKLKDYRTSSNISLKHQEYAVETSKHLFYFLEGNKIDIVLTHDIMFQGWFLPYCLGVRSVSSKLPNIKWFHWVHSIPTGMWDWWDIRMLRPNHKLISPSYSNQHHLAKQFRGLFSDTICIHHIKDPRTWFDFDFDLQEFIKQYPSIMQSDVLQVYPASSDRLTAKRLSEVLQIFGQIKQQGYSVCLVVANQWATTLTRKEDLKKYKWEAECRGLKPGVDLIFTSEFMEPKYESGIPKKMVRDLFQLSNLFIFPTREESFGLVLPEASLAGGCLLVLNRSLEVLNEVSGGNALFFDFGSFNKPFSNIKGDAYYVEIARTIMSKMFTNEAVRAKSYIRQRYNWDNLYKEEYLPAFKSFEEVPK